MIKINMPYNYTEEETATINSRPILNGRDWKESIYRPIIKNIKEHLLQEQKKTCVYCGLSLPLATSYPHIEHIVSKNKHHIFMFERKNLAISCQICNMSKCDKETLIDTSVISYPNNGSGFIIIHPHFDTYSDHIELIDELFLEAKTEKGRKTIGFCKLLRLGVIDERSKNLNIEKQELYKRLVLRLTVEKNDGIIEQILSLIKEVS